MPGGKRGGRTCGFISPVVLLVTMLLLYPLLLAVLLSNEEIMVTRKELLRRRAVRLAELAFHEWAARAGQDRSGSLLPEPLFTARTPWDAPLLEVTDEMGMYACRASLRLDTADRDSLAETGVVLYNRAFGFADSPFETGGYPVLDLHLVGSVGKHRADQRLGLTWVPFLPPENAALVSAGPLRLIGPLLVSGRSSPPETGDAGEPAPPGILAVTAGGPVITEGSVEIDPDPHAPAADLPPADRFRNPEVLLGLPSDSPCLLKRAHLNPGPPPWKGIARHPGDYRGEVAGKGILIVHNPLFDAVLDRASRDHAAGIDNRDFDPSYSHLDPARRPAVLEPRGDSSFRGIIVADDFMPGTGILDLEGQMFILNPSGTSVGMSSGMSIRYSRPTVREHAHGDCDLLLEWLPGGGS